MFLLQGQQYRNVALVQAVGYFFRQLDFRPQFGDFIREPVEFLLWPAQLRFLLALPNF